MSFFRAIGPQLALPAAFFTGAVLFVRNEHHKAVADANQQILRSINDMVRPAQSPPHQHCTTFVFNFTLLGRVALRPTLPP